MRIIITGLVLFLICTKVDAQFAAITSFIDSLDKNEAWPVEQLLIKGDTSSVKFLALTVTLDEDSRFDALMQANTAELTAEGEAITVSTTHLATAELIVDVTETFVPETESRGFQNVYTPERGDCVILLAIFRADGSRTLTSIQFQIVTRAWILQIQE